MPFAHFAPVVRCSALTGFGVQRLPEALRRVAAAHALRVATAELNRVLREAAALHVHPSEDGHPVRLYYATQVATAPPTFLLFVNDPHRVRADWIRYLENRLRARVDLTGTPVRWLTRARPRHRPSPPASGPS
jgi:GTP-binding protein